MKLHIFNPEHDTALAADKMPFTAPHAARQLRHDLGYIAAVWAENGDFVLVDDADSAKEALKRIGLDSLDCVLLDTCQLAKLGTVAFDDICVWGWDKSIMGEIRKFNIKTNASLPSDYELSQWREISGRAWAAEHLLRPIAGCNEKFIGKSNIATTVSEALNQNELDAWVVKSPWSCSGRGVRYVNHNTVSSQLEGWVGNTIEKQGYVMVEPYYTKLRDLAAEFYCDKHGNVKFLGLSLFETKNGAYMGNIVAPEQRKRNVVSKYISLEIIDEAIALIKSLAEKAMAGIYHGHFGIDMMIVDDSEVGVALHPCVELNLRRTMGYVALCMNTADDIPTKVMRMSLDKKYRLRLSGSEDDIWK